MTLPGIEQFDLSGRVALVTGGDMTASMWMIDGGETARSLTPRVDRR